MTAPDNYGFPGSINAAALARWIPSVAASQYGAIDESSCKPTVMSNLDRGVNISPGSIWGDGVLTDFYDNTTLVLPAPATGSIWHLIVARRDWSLGGTTTFVTIEAGATKAMPEIESTPGTVSDQPIAFARVTAGKTTVQEIVDMRVWAANGGIVAKDESVLLYLTRLGSEVTINGQTWQLRPGNNGTAAWEIVGASGKIPIYGVGAAIVGGTPAAGTQFLVQTGTVVLTTDGAGYARITWPKPFPNGVLSVQLSAGDDWSNGAVAFFNIAGRPEVYGPSGYGSKTDVVYAMQGIISGSTWGRLINRTHRDNYTVIGW